MSEIPGAAPRPDTNATRLARAVLDRAIRDAIGETYPLNARRIVEKERHRADLRMDALAWFAGRGGALSFDDCCEILGIDAAAARQAFRRNDPAKGILRAGDGNERATLEAATAAVSVQ